MRRWGIALACAAGWSAAAPAGAQVPELIHQEGLIVDGDGRPVAGPVDLRFALYAAADGGPAVWSEEHADVRLVEGYYSVLLGERRPLTADAVLRAPWLGVAVGEGPELRPRRRLAAVPFALVAGAVKGGPVEATAVHVGGRVVIDARGRWVGDPTGLVGPPGPRGPAGPPGPAGGDGSPDTPPQVLAKLVTVDGTGSDLDADRLDDLDSRQFVRSDVDSSVARNFSVGGDLTVQGNTRLDGTLDADNHDINGVNHLQIDDPGPDGRIEWRGTRARIYVAPLNDGNRDGLLRLQNDDGISLESDVRVTGRLEIAASGLRQGGTQLIDGRGRWLGGFRPQRCPQRQVMVGIDAAGGIVCEPVADLQPPPAACIGGARRVGEDAFGDVPLINFEDVAGPGCVERNRRCPECRRVGAIFRDRGVVFTDATQNVYTSYARSNRFAVANGPCSSWGNRPAEFKFVVPGTDRPGVVSRFGFYTAGLAACNPLRVELFDVNGRRIADFRDVPCGTGRSPNRWYGFMGVGDIHRVRVSGSLYALDDLRVPAPVAPDDPRSCP